MGNIHSKIGPSSLHRLLACPGSYQLSQAVPQAGGSSVYAAEGTVAHGIAESVLIGDALGPEDYVGSTLTEDGFEFDIDPGMAANVKIYTDHCQGLSKNGTHEWVEEMVDLGDLWDPSGPPEPLFGTADFIVWDVNTETLSVCDLKYGRGDVDPYQNPQAMAYALGAMLSLNLDPGIVDIYIVQPRGARTQGIKHWQTTGVDLRVWGEEVLKPGVDALMQPNADLVAGDHCKFCPAKPTCPALKQLAQETAKLNFGPVPPSPMGMTDAELADVLDKAAVVEDWIKAVRAEASGRLDRGKTVPGYKLVPKKGIRKWVDEKAAETWFRGHLPANADLHQKRKLRSPAQMQQAHPDAYKLFMDAAPDLVDASSSGTTLVPDHDPRDALIQRSAKAEFSEV